MTFDPWAVLAAGASTAVGPVAAAYALAAVGLNLQVGHTGLWNLGQVGFMLAGAYGLAVTLTVFGGPVVVGVLVGVLAAVLLALAAGPALRLPPHYLAIATVAAAELLRAVATTARPLTGGPTGLPIPPGSFHAANPFPPGEYDLWLVPLGSEQRVWVLATGWAMVLLALAGADAGERCAGWHGPRGRRAACAPGGVPSPRHPRRADRPGARRRREHLGTGRRLGRSLVRPRVVRDRVRAGDGRRPARPRPDDSAGVAGRAGQHCYSASWWCSGRGASSGASGALLARLARPSEPRAVPRASATAAGPSTTRPAPAGRPGRIAG